MSYDTRRAYGWGQEPSAGTGVSSDTAHRHEYRRDSIAAVTRPPFDNAARLAVDRLLRECLKRRSPTE